MFPKRLYCFFLLALCLGLAPRGFAHPMGNFSVNHYAKISLEREGIKVSYIIDLAEIPTYQELQQGNVTADVADPAVTRFVALRGAEFGRGLSLSINGERLPLRLLSSQVIFPTGAGGLPTMKMGFVYQAAYPPNHSTGGLEYADNNYPGHAGWKEIVAVGAAADLISSSVPQTDRSAELTNYPTDLLNSPPQDLSAAIQFRYPVSVSKDTAGPSTPLPRHAPRQAGAGGTGSSSPTPVPFNGENEKMLGAPFKPSVGLSGQRSCPGTCFPVRTPSAKPPGPATLVPAPEPLHLQANQQATPRSAFTELITTRSMSLWFLITAAFIALGLGALHALEPGHGKTIVAAYLVGSRGTARHALLLGLIVTASHTAGVFALGAITLYASRYIVPEQLYPWLGVFSGLTIAGLGGYMFLRRWSGLDLDHSHTSGQLHSHWFSSNKS